MNHKKLIIITALAVLVVGGGVFVFTMNKDDKNVSQSTTQTQTADTNTQEHEGNHAMEQGNIYSLVDIGHAHKCTFTYNGSNGTGTGTMYTNGKGNGLMTIDVKTAEGKTGTINTLLLADDAYGWTQINGSTIGFKFKKSSVQADAKKAAGSATTDPSQKFDLACENWTVNDSLFVVPSNVQFMSLPTN